MTKTQRIAKQIVADAERSVKGGNNIAISALNYGVSATPALLNAIRVLVGQQWTVETEGFLCYIQFRRAEIGDK